MVAESLFLYEWVTGGGMAGREGRLPETLLREGLAMVQAVAADAAEAGVELRLMRDLGGPPIVAPGVRTTEVDSRSTHDRVLAELSAECDATIVLAPETDGALAKAVAAAEAAEARLASPGAEWVRIAACKATTNRHLAEAGVPIPAWRQIEAGEPLPSDFAYPAVAKPLDGAGSQDTHAVASVADRPPSYAWPRLLQTLVAGAPVSIAAIGVRGGAPVILPPCRQRISLDGRFTYDGGQTPLPPGLAARATKLAEATLTAMPPLVGYAGFDLVLGGDADGSRDYVIEVNPRLTTSYVGLRAACRGSLVEAMLHAARGETPTLEFDDRPLAFDPDGTVYYASS